MNESIGNAANASSTVWRDVCLPATDIGSRGHFYVVTSAVLLLLVFMGFSRTLYLRPVFDVPPLSSTVWVHGILLTAWYVGAFVQTLLVAGRRIGVHRRLGWAMAGMSVAVFVMTTVTTLNLAGRQIAGGSATGTVVWADLSALFAFAIFLPSAMALRRRRDAHSRLMLLASISMLQPATNRIWRWTVFRGLDVNFASTVVLALLLFTLALFDLRSQKRLHAVTVIGGTFLLASRVLSVYVMSGSQWARFFERFIV